MKKQISTLILFLLLLSCKDDRAPAFGGELYGEWYLTELYMDPGDGSGTWRNAPASSLKAISFNRDHTFTAEENSGFDFLLNYSSFKVQSPSNLIFYTTNRTDSTVIGYTVTSAKLELTPTCIEGCGLRYSKVTAF